VTELAELMERARARAAETHAFDPNDLVEPDERYLAPAVRRRRHILRVLLAELLVAAERGEEWYVWVRDEWPRRRTPTR
jgi:hypothetical protein